MYENFKQVTGDHDRMLAVREILEEGFDKHSVIQIAVAAAEDGLDIEPFDHLYTREGFEEKVEDWSPLVLLERAKYSKLNPDHDYFYVKGEGDNCDMFSVEDEDALYEEYIDLRPYALSNLAEYLIKNPKLTQDFDRGLYELIRYWREVDSQ